MNGAGFGHVPADRTPVENVGRRFSNINKIKIPKRCPDVFGQAN